MHIYVDADACPRPVKEILFRAVERLAIPLVLVANQKMGIPGSRYISALVADAGPDEADDRIVELVHEGDLVISADIPLADRVIEKGAYVINPRGELYTKDNIKEHLTTRDLMDELRNSGVETSGPGVYRPKDRQAFANQLDRFLTKFNT
ncbi:MAG: YaiI/YqxD family protein [bacterium]|nr:YaiI/YqxD family protein [bacterium]